MFEHFTTLDEIVRFKLSSAWSMEQDTATMLAVCTQFAQSPNLRSVLDRHARQTQVRVTAIERCFGLLGEDKVKTVGCPTTKGLADESRTAIRKSDDRVVDAVILCGALESAHYQIAVYQALALYAHASGAPEVAEVVRDNLAQVEAGRDEVAAAARQIAV